MIFVPERNHFRVIVTVAPERVGVEIAAIPLERVLLRQRFRRRPGLAPPAVTVQEQPAGEAGDHRGQ